MDFHTGKNGIPCLKGSGRWVKRSFQSNEEYEECRRLFIPPPALPMALGAICRTMKRLHSGQNITSFETQWLRDTPRMWCHMLETAVWANAFLLMHMRPLGPKPKVIKHTLKSKTIARRPAGSHLSSAQTIPLSEAPRQDFLQDGHHDKRTHLIPVIVTVSRNKHQQQKGLPVLDFHNNAAESGQKTQEETGLEAITCTVIWERIA